MAHTYQSRDSVKPRILTLRLRYPTPPLQSKGEEIWEKETLDINLLLLLVGMFLETGAAITVLAPILTPVALMMGIDPIHFGIVMIVNLAVGMTTPPVGVNLFVACQVAGLRIEHIIRSMLPFYLSLLICLAIITYLPGLSLWHFAPTSAWTPPNNQSWTISLLAGLWSNVGSCHSSWTAVFLSQGRGLLISVDASMPLMTGLADATGRPYTFMTHGVYGGRKFTAKGLSCVPFSMVYPA